jgi:hypothetical protein
MVLFEEIVLEINLKKLHKDSLFSFISFVNEKENSKKGSNLGPLGYKGNYTQCISFFSFEHKNKIFFSSMNHCEDVVKINLNFFSQCSLYYILL